MEQIKVKEISNPDLLEKLKNRDLKDINQEIINLSNQSDFKQRLEIRLGLYSELFTVRGGVAGDLYGAIVVNYLSGVHNERSGYGFDPKDVEVLNDLNKEYEYSSEILANIDLNDVKLILSLIETRINKINLEVNTYIERINNNSNGQKSLSDQSEKYELRVSIYFKEIEALESVSDYLKKRVEEKQTVQTA